MSEPLDALANRGDTPESIQYPLCLNGLYCTVSVFVFFLVEIYCDITTALWSRDGSAVVSLPASPSVKN